MRQSCCRRRGCPSLEWVCMFVMWVWKACAAAGVPKPAAKIALTCRDGSLLVLETIPLPSVCPSGAAPVTASMSTSGEDARNRPYKSSASKVFLFQNCRPTVICHDLLNDTTTLVFYFSIPGRCDRVPCASAVGVNAKTQTRCRSVVGVDLPPIDAVSKVHRNLGVKSAAWPRKVARTRNVAIKTFGADALCAKNLEMGMNR